MFLPEVQENINTREMITQWRGYNHNYSIGLGEFYDMENMSCDGFPVIAARDIRPTLLHPVHLFRGILYTDSALCYLDGNTFHYKSWMIDLSPLVEGTATEVVWDDTFVDQPDVTELTWTEQKLIRFGAYILIYPMEIWVNTSDTAADRKAGKITSRFVSATGVHIKYTISKKDGSEYQNVVAQATAPSSPAEGDYWLNTTTGSEGLNVYLQSSWQPVATCYIRIEIRDAQDAIIHVGFDDYFVAEDVVNMNSATVTDINNGSVLQTVTADYITVIGLMDAVTKQEITSSGYKLEIKRVMPILDYLCADKNRLWGCRYGYDSSGNLINEIYASKLGDFKNWYSFQGISTDSYTATIGVPGKFTGCISYGGYPTFFKENAIIRVSGSFPAEYNVMVMDARGVQDNSSKSLAIVGETLFYKAPGGVMAYDGSLPRLISEAWGRNAYYYDGIAGVCGNKYYIDVNDSRGAHRMFVYDAQLGLWTKENHLYDKKVDPEEHTTTMYYMLGFSGSLDGRLFAFTNQSIYGMGLSDNELYTNKKVGEEFVTWYLESGDIGLDIPEFKRISKLTFRAYIPSTSEISVEISYDDKPFEPVGDIRGFQETMTHVLKLAPYRCDHYKIKMSGHGAVRIYSLAITYDAESDDYEYKN